MRESLNDRAKLLGAYICENHSTIRKAAKEFCLSKSTVHIDVSKRLKKINPILYSRVNKILLENFNEKHIRGGESTKKKYLIKNN